MIRQQTLCEKIINDMPTNTFKTVSVVHVYEVFNDVYLNLNYKNNRSEHFDPLVRAGH